MVEYEEFTIPDYPGVVIRLPKHELTQIQKERMYIQSLEVLHHKVETFRRYFLSTGLDREYIKCDEIEQKEKARIFKHFFGDVPAVTDELIGNPE